MKLRPPAPTLTDIEILHGHLFCGLGGGAKGFNRGTARVGNLRAKFRCVGGIDSDDAAIADFTRAAGVRGTVRDLFSRDQYEAFHGLPPPPDWREATTADIHNDFGSERPHIIFLSAPCKGFSGLLAESKSLTAKYQALNALTLRGVWLALEAYKDDPVELFVFENVPRIAKRGRKLLDRIVALFRAYGYVVAETTHDCGELGGLGQSRKRFLLVARHREKVPNFLYEPEKKSLRGVGEIIGRFPVPGPDLILPMHRMPSLQWKTWVGASSTKMRVTEWDGSSGTVTGSQQVGSGALAVADIRPADRDDGYKQNKYRVTAMDEASGAVIGASTTGNGAFAVADVRPHGLKENRDAYLTGGHYGVVPWPKHGNAVSASALHDNGFNSVADPRDANGNIVPFKLPKPNDRLVCCIRALDGTWHRPFTTLELAALQSLVSDPEEYLALEGLSDSAWRERIGNAVPPDAAESMAGVMGQALLGAWSGHTFMLSSQPIWVRNIAIGLSVKQLEELAA